MTVGPRYQLSAIYERKRGSRVTHKRLRAHGLLLLVLVMGIAGILIWQRLAFGAIIANRATLFGVTLVAIHLLGVVALGAAGYFLKRRVQ